MTISSGVNFLTSISIWGWGTFSEGEGYFRREGLIRVCETGTVDKITDYQIEGYELNSRLLGLNFG